MACCCSCSGIVSAAMALVTGSLPAMARTWLMLALSSTQNPVPGSGFDWCFGPGLAPAMSPVMNAVMSAVMDADAAAEVAVAVAVAPAAAVHPEVEPSVVVLAWLLAAASGSHPCWLSPALEGS